MRAERAAQLTNHLLAFARKQIIDPQVLSLNDLIGDIEWLLRRLLGADVELIARLEADLPPLKADPGQAVLLVLFRHLSTPRWSRMPGDAALALPRCHLTKGTQ